jgi:hypothetical protein
MSPYVQHMQATQPCCAACHNQLFDLTFFVRLEWEVADVAVPANTNQPPNPAVLPATPNCPPHLLVGLEWEVVDVAVRAALQPLEQLALNGLVQARSNLSLGLAAALALLSPASDTEASRAVTVMQTCLEKGTRV